VSRLELDLLEYIHTREAIAEQAVREYGPVGAHELATERGVLAQVRAVMEGRYAPTGSAA
jgi:hypothetical protein